jgi:hypothetical protein
MWEYSKKMDAFDMKLKRPKAYLGSAAASDDDPIYKTRPAM